MAKLILEGQTHEIPDEVAKNGATIAEQDHNLLDVLRPNFDLAANATLRREEKDGVLTITVVKAPLTKGADGSYARIVGRLVQAPHEMSRLLEFACTLHLMEAQGRLNRDRLIALRPQIEHVLETDRADQRRITSARQVLTQAPAMPSVTVPIGF